MYICITTEYAAWIEMYVKAVNVRARYSSTLALCSPRGPAGAQPVGAVGRSINPAQPVLQVARGFHYQATTNENLCLRHRECLGYHSPLCTSHRPTITVGPTPHPPVSPGDGDDRRVDQILLHSTHTYPSIPTTVRRPSEESLARGRTDAHHQKGRRHARSGRLGGVLHGLLAHDAPHPPLPADSQEASLIQLRSQLHELDKDECVAGCTVTGLINQCHGPPL